MKSQSKDHRPVNLDIGTIRLPITAYASITHRITGVALFIASFVLLWLLDISLASEESFDRLVIILGSPFGKLITWGIATLLSYHSLAGVKHLVMDAGIGETMQGGITGAKIVFLAAAIASVFWGVVLW